MKIGVLTYHRTVNEGSVLQAYCLVMVLRKLFPNAIVEIIDYRPFKKELAEAKKLFGKKPPFFRVQQFLKLRTLRSFVACNLPVSSRRVVTDNYRRAIRFIDRQNYDVVVVGSDTAWADQSSMSKLPAPNAYFLPGLTGPIKIAFAVSMDQTEKARLDAVGHRDSLRVLVEDFDFVSVRDGNSRGLLKQLGVRQVPIEYLPDPTILNGLGLLLRRGVPETTRPELAKPMAGVSLVNKDIRQIAVKWLERHGYEVVLLLGEDRATSAVGKSIESKLSLYEHLEVLITDRFHGSIFQLSLGKGPAVFVEMESIYPESNSKGRDLFVRLGLEDFVIRSSEFADSEERVFVNVASWEARAEAVQAAMAGLQQAGWLTLAKIQTLVEYRLAPKT